MKIEELQFLKLKEPGYQIFPITEITQNDRVYLFYSKEYKVDYSLYTDGNIEHLDTWIDKYPYNRDLFIKSCSPVKRFDFRITDSNIVLIEKRQQDRLVRNLYVEEEKFYQLLFNSVYQVSINSYENISIRKMEKIKWKLKEL